MAHYCKSSEANVSFPLKTTTYPKSLHYVINLRDALRKALHFLIIIQCRWRLLFCKYLIRCNKGCGLSFFQLDVSHYPIRARVSQNGIESGTTRTLFLRIRLHGIMGLDITSSQNSDLFYSSSLEINSSFSSPMVL
jgi:hypothetical protein